MLPSCISPPKSCPSSDRGTNGVRLRGVIYREWLVSVAENGTIGQLRDIGPWKRVTGS